jgi:hypothetical protein
MSASCASMMRKNAPLQNTLDEITANSTGSEIYSMGTAPKLALQTPWDHFRESGAKGHCEACALPLGGKA